MGKTLTNPRTKGLRPSQPNLIPSTHGTSADTSLSPLHDSPSVSYSSTTGIMGETVLCCCGSSALDISISVLGSSQINARRAPQSLWNPSGAVPPWEMGKWIAIRDNYWWTVEILFFFFLFKSKKIHVGGDLKKLLCTHLQKHTCLLV